jgi:hypothetical protein
MATVTNPLHVLGLSHEFMKLPLSKEQRYEYCTRMRKVLLSILHPDKGGSHEVYVQIGQNLGKLDDKQAFAGALLHLQQGNEDSTQVSLLQAKVLLLEMEKSRLNRATQHWYTGSA